MTYPDAIQFLYSLRLFGTKMGLENSFRLAELAGNPHRQLRFIHVAGTNGKGSTCAMLESIYRRAGWRVGLFTSPHLLSFRERMQVDRQLITEEDVVRLVEELQPGLHLFPESRHPTFFEVITVMALRYFVEQRCELVIWETGLGGRLDATNIVLPLASVITNIQFDHEQWLGHTLAQIAYEKAGIIKPSVPVLTAAEEPEAFAVIRETALRQQAPLTRVTPSDQARPPLDGVELPLLGEHQKLNAALAVATARCLNPVLPVNDRILAEGLERVHWPGRLQCHRTESGGIILLDGAHNPAGAESLRRALEQCFPGQKPALILGILRDKDWEKICRILIPAAGRVLLAPVHSDRTTLPTELRQVCAALAPRGEALLCSSIAEALDRAREDRLVLVTGSLHFVGEALERLHLLPATSGERSLNEWDASAAGRPGQTATVP